MAYIPTKAKSSGASGKYKTYSRGEGGTVSGTGGGLPKSEASSGVRFETNEGRLGYAPEGTTIKSGSREVLVAPQGGGSVRQEAVGGRSIAAQQAAATQSKPLSSSYTPPAEGTERVSISGSLYGALKFQKNERLGGSGLYGFSGAPTYYVDVPRGGGLGLQRELAARPLYERIGQGVATERETSIRRQQPFTTKAQLVLSGIVEIPKSIVIGTSKIASSEVRTSRVPFAPIPDFTFRTAETRIRLLAYDRDVQTAAIAGAIVATSTMPGATGAIVSTSARLFALGLGGYEAYQGYKTADYRRLGQGAFLFASGGPFKFIERPFTEIVGRKTPIEYYTGGKVTAGSSAESARMFEAGRTPEGLNVVHASDVFLKGEARAGPKGAAGIEDPGLYTAPVGRANIGFTGLSESSYNRDISIIPRFFGARPSISTIKVRDVSSLPKNVLREPGFAGPARQGFIVESKGSGLVYFTKRSLLGFGELPRQRYNPRQDYIGGDLVRLRGRTYVEAGTSEAEAVINPGERLTRQISGIRDRFSYTIYDQKKIGGFDVPFTGELIRTPRYVLEAIPSRKIIGFETRRGRSTREFVAREELISSKYLASRGSTPLRSYYFGGDSSGGFSSQVSRSLAKPSGSISSISRGSSGFSSVSVPISQGISSISRGSGFSGGSVVSLPSGSFGSSNLSRKVSGFSPSVPSVPPSYPPPFKYGFGGGPGRLRDFGAVRATRYTPSFSALFFNIRGTYKPSKYSRSGVDFRPIIPGYKLTSFRTRGGYPRGVRLAL